MFQTTLICLAALALLGIVLWSVGTWNHLIRLRNQVDQAFSGIDVLLAQRHDEIPVLTAICEGAMKHERETLERVTELRQTLRDTRVLDDLAVRLPLENDLTECLGTIHARIEDYPELKTSGLMSDLMDRMTSLEERLADRREVFNDAVTHFNDAVSQVPGVWFAAALNYRPLSVLEVELPAERPAELVKS